MTSIRRDMLTFGKPFIQDHAYIGLEAHRRNTSATRTRRNKGDDETSRLRNLYPTFFRDRGAGRERERYREVEDRVRGVRESLKFLQRSVLCEYLDKRAHVAG